MGIKQGAMPDRMLRRLMHGGYIQGAQPAHVQPSSLDLTVADIWRVDGLKLPGPKTSIWQLRNVLNAIPMRSMIEGVPQDHGHLVPGVSYLAKLNQSLKLPRGIYGLANPKSTTGRLDIQVQLVVDSSFRFDTVPEGYSGELYAFITSHSFSIKVGMGQKLLQLRLFNGDTRLSETELEMEMDASPLLYSKEGRGYRYSDLEISDRDGTCLLTLDLDQPVGWRSKDHAPEIDLAAEGTLDPKDFFEPVVANGGVVTFIPNRFHILSTAQCVRVPPHLACEMRAMDEKSGDFRVHYAGFIDPGWGFGLEGEGRGRPLTLEIRPMRQLFVGRRQPVAKIGFERLFALPGRTYDSGSSSYKGQRGPQLARQFKAPA